MVVSPSGRAAAFDLEVLRSNLLQCFMQSNIPEYYLAEDIALAVEFALTANERPQKIFTESEINSAVIKILEQTGIAAVADYYSRKYCHTKLSISSRIQAVKELLERNLSSDSSCDFEAIANKVIEATSTLNINEASPTLYIELARYFQQHSEKEFSLPHPNQPMPNSKSRYELVTVKEMTRELPEFAKELQQAGILEIYPVSRVFPTIRFTLNIIPFAKNHQLSSPITEMMLATQIYELGQAMKQMIARTRQRYRLNSGKAKDIPVNMSVPDMCEFANEWLLWPLPDGEKGCIELLEPFSCEDFTLRYN